MSFFERIKKLFSRKKEGNMAASKETQFAEIKEPEIKQEILDEMKDIHQKEPENHDKPPKQPERRQKTCPHCNSPNDTFVHKCWLCKKDI